MVSKTPNQQCWQFNNSRHTLTSHGIGLHRPHVTMLHLPAPLYCYPRWDLSAGWQSLSCRKKPYLAWLERLIEASQLVVEDRRFRGNSNEKTRKTHPYAPTSPQLLQIHRQKINFPPIYPFRSHRAPCQEFFLPFFWRADTLSWLLLPCSLPKPSDFFSNRQLPCWTARPLRE